MPTPEDFFKSDFSTDLVIASTQHFEGVGVSVSVPTKLTIDFERNSCSVSFYIDSSEFIFDIASALLQALPSILDTKARGVIKYSTPGDDARHADNFRFTGRVCFYCAETIDRLQRDRFIDLASKGGLSVMFRDAAYAAARTAAETPLAFVSHDSRDKDLIARPLAYSLQQRGCPVWYDEFSLKIGDSLRESIERGIATCNKCILVITTNFLTNHGWTKSEFNAVFSKEIHEGRKNILPVWAGVTRSDVYSYSPILVDRYAGMWEGDADALAARLLKSIQSRGD